jgi:periplasmic copper chaperone A
MIRHRRSAGALVLGAVAAGVLGFAAPASAHVTVNPSEATQGGFARLAFRVPNESDTASTTKLEVVLPEDAAVASVSTMPVPGWTVGTEKRKLTTPLDVDGAQITEAVSKITWTATGAAAAIKPGQFQEFPVSMGPLPEVDQMVFKALQTYSDGNVVRWIEEPPANGGEEPQSPAPVLKLVPAAATASAAGTPAAQPAPEADEDGSALAVGIAGLVAGLAGLGLAAAAFARTRRAAPPAT